MHTSLWRWFPAWLIAAMGLVFVVNAYMVYDAYRTFPGAAGTDGFDLSNDYKRILAASRQQQSLGWRIEAGVTPAHYPRLHLAGRDGSPLAAAAIDARAERPVGPADTSVLKFQAAGNGWYQAETPLVSGQWDILLTVRGEGQLYSATRRVVVK